MLHIRDNVYMLLGDGGNIVVQTGDEGAFVVDTGEGKLSDKVIAAIRRIESRGPSSSSPTPAFMPITWEETLSSRRPVPTPACRVRSSTCSRPARRPAILVDPAHHATIMAQNNVVHPSGGGQSARRWIPADTYLEERRRKFHNGELIELFYEPNAITDGDSIVHFRRSDVIAAGDIFNTTQYPFIDLKNGGSVQGEIKALNDILSRTGYEHDEQGGTYIVPGHGYLCDEHEVTGVPRHGGHRAGSRAGDDEGRRDSRSGQGGSSHRRL